MKDCPTTSKFLKGRSKRYKRTMRFGISYLMAIREDHWKTSCSIPKKKEQEKEIMGHRGEFQLAVSN